MDFMQALRILRKRWILTCAMLVVVFVALVGAGLKLPRTYQAQSAVVLLASKNSTKTSGDNPYLSFFPSLTLTADVLRRVEMGSSASNALAAEGHTAKYTVTDAPDTSGPVLLVAVTGSTRATVEGTLVAVTNDLSNQLSQLQNGVTPPNRIRLETLSVTAVPSLSLSKMARPLAVVVIFGLLFTLAVPLIVDSRSNRRRAKKWARAGNPDDIAPDEVADAQQVLDSRVAHVPSKSAPSHSPTSEPSAPRIR